MLIREATVNDIPLLAKLAQETYTETFGRTMTKDELIKALESRSEKYFKSVLGKDTILDVYAENEKALGLYKKYGFKIIGKTPFKVKGKILGYDLLMKRKNK